MVDKVEDQADYAEAARVLFEASRDRFMRVEQCYEAIDALVQAGFITDPTPANGEQVERDEMAKRLFWADTMLGENADRIQPEWRDKWWDELATMPLSGPGFLRKWHALAAATLSTPTEDARERDKARQIVRDIYWMARRYADGRQSYAVGMFNDAVRKAYDAGWLIHKLDHEPPFARDSMFSPEWKSIEQRAHEAEQEVARLRRAIERHHSGEDGDRELYTALGNKETDRHG